LAAAAAGYLPDGFDLLAAHGVEAVVEVDRGIAVRRDEFDSLSQAGFPVASRCVQDGDDAYARLRPAAPYTYR
jgi:hypothetical protein